MLKTSWTEKKSNLEVLRAAGIQHTLMKTIRQKQLDLSGQATRRNGLKNVVVSVVNGKVEGRESEMMTKTEMSGQPVYVLEK